MGLGETHLWYQTPYRGNEVPDITDRNPNEPDLHQYKQLIETLPIGYVRTTVSGEFRAVNSTFVDMVGGDSQEDVLSRDVEEFYQDSTTGRISSLHSPRRDRSTTRS